MFNSLWLCYESLMIWHGDTLSDSSGHCVTVCPPCLFSSLCSRQSDSAASFWRSMPRPPADTYIYNFCFLSTPLVVRRDAIYGSAACYRLVIASNIDRPWLILCAGVTRRYSVPLSSVGGVISDSFTALRLFRERGTRGTATFIYVHRFPRFLFPALRRRIFVAAALPLSNSL